MPEELASKFAMSISQLQEQPATVVDETTAAPETVVDTTTAAPTTTDETTQAPAENADVSVIDHLRTQYGVEDALENTPEGLQALIDKVAAQREQTAIENKLKSNPILGELDAHLASGKSVESFFQVRQVQSEKIVPPAATGDEAVDKQNQEACKQIISAVYKANGMSDRQINRFLEASELEGTLFEDAKEISDKWNAGVDERSAAVLQQEEAVRAAAIEEEKKVLANINAILDSGKINGAVIPKADIDGLRKFSLEQDAEGLTARDRAIAQLPLEKFMLIDYLLYKDFDVKGLVLPATKVATLGTLKNPLSGNPAPAEGNAAEQQQLPSSLSGMNFGKLVAQ